MRPTTHFDEPTPKECLAEELLSLDAARAGDVPPWMTMEQAIAEAERQISKTKAVIARHGNRWPDDDEAQHDAEEAEIAKMAAHEQW